MSEDKAASVTSGTRFPKLRFDHSKHRSNIHDLERMIDTYVQTTFQTGDYTLFAEDLKIVKSILLKHFMSVSQQGSSPRSLDLKYLLSFVLLPLLLLKEINWLVPVLLPSVPVSSVNSSTPTPSRAQLDDDEDYESESKSDSDSDGENSDDSSVDEDISQPCCCFGNRNAKTNYHDTISSESKNKIKAHQSYNKAKSSMNGFLLCIQLTK
jgi:hypothetical protein